MTLQIVGRFLLQMAIGAVLFAAVALVAAGLWLFTEWLGRLGIPYHISFVSGLMAELLYFTSTFCVLRYS